MIEKMCLENLKNNKTNFAINKQNKKEYFGIKKYYDNEIMLNEDVGYSIGLAYNQLGGSVLKIECKVS